MPNVWLLGIYIYFLDIYKVYCADHTYTTLKLMMDTPVEQIVRHAADKLSIRSDDLVLCEVKSSGGNLSF